VQTVDEVVDDPQARAAGALVEVPDDGGTATMVATPVDFADTPWQPRSMPPELGQHTDAILGELGMTNDEVKALRERGVVA
jgi:crotonobetainyl-CoA:carnitine CoA-transferase CaiB-like acyl-CoA transferase